jgi:hypothetical protein
MSLGLLSGVMLAWGASLLIPWLIDRWWPLPPRQFDWPGLRLVERALRHRRRAPLRAPRNGLMRLRMTLLGLLAVAASEPVLHWSNHGSDNPIDSPGLVVFVLDAGYPMQAAAPGSASHWEQLLQLTDRQLSELAPGTAAAVIRLGPHAEALLPAATWDLTALRRKVAELVCSDGLADVAGGLRQVGAIVQRWRQATATDLLGMAEVRWLSDFRRGSWEPAETPDTLRLAEQLAGECRFLPVPIGSPTAVPPIPSRNASLESVRLIESLPGPSTPATVEAVIFNGGEQPLGSGLLQLWSGAQLLASRPVNLEIGERKRVTLPWTPPRPGSRALQVRLVLEDDLPLDNQRWLPIEVCESFQVLILEGEPEAGRYLELALQPDPSEPSPWTLGRRVHTELDPSQLDQLERFDALVVVDPGPELLWYREPLLRWCTNGGKLMVWLGPRAWPSTFTGSDTLPFELLEPAEVGSQTIDPLEYRSPWLGPFAASPESGLIDTPLFRYWRIRPHEAASLEIALALSGGEPLVVEQQLGLGRAIWSLTPPTVGNQLDPNLSWNALAAWPTFVPLVQQQLRHLLSEVSVPSAVVVGEPPPAGWQLVAAGGSSGGALWPPVALESTGLVRIRPVQPEEPGDADPARWLAVQLDPQGGWLTPWPLPPWLEPSATPPGLGGSQLPPSPGGGGRLPLERWAIGLCLAMLLLESGWGRPAAKRRSRWEERAGRKRLPTSPAATVNRGGREPVEAGR